MHFARSYCRDSRWISCLSNSNRGIDRVLHEAQKKYKRSQKETQKPCRPETANDIVDDQLDDDSSKKKSSSEDDDDYVK